MSDCDRQLLSVYHDGELDAAARERVEMHLRHCDACAAELRQIREISEAIAAYNFGALSNWDYERLRAAIDDAADQSVWRLGGALGLIAASVLIVSCAWLMELGGGDSGGSPQQAISSPRVEPWERMAMTLRPEPLMLTRDDTARVADARLADWMLQGLSENRSSQQ